MSSAPSVLRFTRPPHTAPTCTCVPAISSPQNQVHRYRSHQVPHARESKHLCHSPIHCLCCFALCGLRRRSTPPPAPLHLPLLDRWGWEGATGGSGGHPARAAPSYLHAVVTVFTSVCSANCQGDKNSLTSLFTLLETSFKTKQNKTITSKGCATLLRYFFLH